ncbi:HSP18 transcriptional regulator [Actinophytocola sp.]|uniref:HSP18 transcriptional regulator n=1 Tax=Actinophytocola sp. TaxID=1872138 RepID=UPI002D7F4FD6|nr:HSP18 transcriptional regulator [Actinophytocola sp.]HET9142463.1 HSP18 transcriptional regulator [Actinophytocola sp.]
MGDGDTTAEHDTSDQRLRTRPVPTDPGAVEALALVHAVLAELGDPATGQASSAPAPADLLAALTVLRSLRAELAAWEPRLITAARHLGISWATLAPALGVTSRQAAERRYLRLQPSATGEQTGEERVRAERTKRAGDRAVAAWARQNSSTLRQLAGQIGALQGLSGPAQHRVDQLTHALADNDPAALLTPLADTRDQLDDTHTDLANRVKSVTDHVDQLRHRVRDRRQPH